MASEDAESASEALKDLLNLARTHKSSTPTSLAQQTGLTQMVFGRLGLETPEDAHTRGLILETVLSRVAAHARATALDRLGATAAKWVDVPIFQAAAAAELLELTDRSMFEVILKEYCRTKKKSEVDQERLRTQIQEQLRGRGGSENWQKHDDSRGRRRRSQLRAGIWTEQSQTSAKRKEPQLLKEFESAAVDYIVSHRKELVELVSGYIERAPQSSEGSEPRSSARTEGAVAPALDATTDAGSTPTEDSDSRHVGESLDNVSPHTPQLASLTANQGRRLINRRRVAVALVVVLLATGGGIAYLLKGRGGPPNGPGSAASPIPTSTLTGPILVESVSQIQSNSAAEPIVLPEPLIMTRDQLAKFNTDIYPHSRPFSSWYQTHSGAAAEFGVLTVTLRGNTKETVHISDMKAIKQCRKPFDGTYFEGYSAGTGDTIRIGFDLDSPDPSAQEMALTEARGLFPDGSKYFQVHSISLSPGETEKLTVGAFTRRYSCSFSLQLIIATSNGTFSEEIKGHDGKLFKVTALARPIRSQHPLSGYRAGYVQDEHSVWKQIDPSTYRR